MIDKSIYCAPITNNGFKSLKIKLHNYENILTGQLRIKIIVMQIEDDGNNRTIIQIDVPGDYSIFKVISNKLNKNFGAKKINKDFMFDIYEVKDKKMEVYEWFQSLAILYKLSEVGVI